MITNAVIPAGGRGSRMGPLAAQISKALVSIGNQPHLVRQINLLRKSGVDGEIVIVVSPETETQVEDVLIRCGLRDDVVLVTQQYARGPIDAMLHGLVSLDGGGDSRTVVLMSDTYLNETIPIGGEWVGTGITQSVRGFCIQEPNGVWSDRTCPPLSDVFIGIVSVDTFHALAACESALDKPSPEGKTELGMSVFLNEYERPLRRRQFETWQDTGDVMALIRARRASFISRDHHRLSLRGSVITKYGGGPDFTAQRQKMHMLSDLTPELVPAVHEMRDESYTMEYIDMPSLAELWLYWPGHAETWRDILAYVIEQLSETVLWEPKYGYATSGLEHRFYVDKAERRLEGTKYQNLEWYVRRCQRAGLYAGSHTVLGHGDLNFGNVFFSMNSGAIKLIDPRGSRNVPLSYELGKLAFSFDAGLSAITHGLDPVKVQRTHGHEIDVMRQVIVEHDAIGDPRRLAAIQASMMCSSLPLHPEEQQPYMAESARRLFAIALKEN